MMSDPRAEWESRYAARVRKRAGWTSEECAEAARVGAVAHEESERGCGNAVAWEDPEGAADEEMSYWTDDGEG
jgi:hypothetical protein